MCSLNATRQWKLWVILFHSTVLVLPPFQCWTYFPSRGLWAADGDIGLSFKTTNFFIHTLKLLLFPHLATLCRCIQDIKHYFIFLKMTAQVLVPMQQQIRKYTLLCCIQKQQQQQQQQACNNLPAAVHLAECGAVYCNNA